MNPNNQDYRQHDTTHAGRKHSIISHADRLIDEEALSEIDVAFRSNLCKFTQSS